MALDLIQYLSLIGYDLTLAEMALEEKNKISHRAKAFNKLHEMLL